MSGMRWVKLTEKTSLKKGQCYLVSFKTEHSPRQYVTSRWLGGMFEQPFVTHYATIESLDWFDKNSAQ